MNGIGKQWPHGYNFTQMLSVTVPRGDHGVAGAFGPGYWALLLYLNEIKNQNIPNFVLDENA